MAAAYPSAAESDGEYEYEYSTTETETYLVDLDLTTLNGPVKSVKTTSRRKLQTSGSGIRPFARKPPATTSTPQHPSITASTSTPNPDATPSRTNDDPATPQDHADSPTPIPTTNDTSEATDGPRHERLQILDLHTSQPIVSYLGELYSCSWVDTIGTNMFFSSPDELSDLVEPALKREGRYGYDLVGTSRIRLVGRRGKVTEKKGKKRGRPAGRAIEEGRESVDGEDDPGEGDEDDDDDDDVGGARGARRAPMGDVRSTNRQRQVDFLKRLAVVKKAKGDKDVVRTFVSKTAAAKAEWDGGGNGDRNGGDAAGGRSWTKEAYQEEIERLNQRIVRGDRGAAEELQELYDQMDDGEDDDDAVSEDRRAAVRIVDGTNEDRGHEVEEEDRERLDGEDTSAPVAPRVGAKQSDAEIDDGQSELETMED